VFFRVIIFRFGKIMDKFKQCKSSFRLIQMIGLLKKIHVNYCPYIYE